jgi:succinoglycan biosynthesis transport protein ExoP
MAYDAVNRGRTEGNGNGNGGSDGAIGAPSATEQIRDIVHVLFKRKRLIGALFLAVALPGLISTALRKPSYTATAKVMISRQRNDPTVQPTDLTKIDPIQINDALINSEVQVINSRDLLERVVRGLAQTSDGPPHVTATSTPFGQQVLGMGLNLLITPIKSSNVIQIDYKAPVPERAVQVVNRVVDEYLAYHALVHGAKGLSQFYDEQQRTLARQLRKAEETLAAFTDSEGIVSPKDEIQVALRSVAEVSSSLRDVTTSIAGTEERLRAVRDQVASQPEVIKQSQSLEINPVITQLSRQLIERQVDRVALLRKYTDKDRHVRDNAEEISELRSQLESESRDHPTVVANQQLRANPIREERLHALLDLEGALKEMRGRQAVLEEELSRTNRRLVDLQQKSIDFDRLDQEVKTRRDTYEVYVKREQEARISQAMDEQKLVNVNVIQRPALPLASSSKQAASVAVILIAGLVVALAGTFGREYMTRSLHSEGDVSRQLGMPLLASIGELPQR